jgi:hypothetical protein
MPLGLLAAGVAVVVVVALFSARLRAPGSLGWLGGLLVVGSVLALVGFRLTLRAVIVRYGSLRVPTWVGLVVVLALVAIPFLVVLLR